MQDKNLNNSSDHGVNRGFELMLHGGKRKQPNAIHTVYQKVVRFLKREVTIYFEFSLDIKRK